MADGDGMVGVATLTDGFKLDIRDFGVINVMCELVHALFSEWKQTFRKVPKALGTCCPQPGHSLPTLWACTVVCFLTILVDHFQPCL